MPEARRRKIENAGRWLALVVLIWPRPGAAEAGARAASASSPRRDAAAASRPERRGTATRASAGRSAASALGNRTYPLSTCLALARRNYPRVEEARAKLRQKEAQRDEAYAAPFSEFKLRSGLGVAPTVSGTSVYSPSTDEALSDNMALAWQVQLEGAIPLWTFGKLESLWDAAGAQVTVGEHEVAKAKNDVALDVRRAYYGLQFARDALALVYEAASKMDDFIESLSAAVANGEGDDIELLKLQIYRAELTARESEARQHERSAHAALRFLTGVRGPFDIPDEPLRRLNHRLAPLPQYLNAARLYRPEVNMARAGVLARQAQLRLEQSRYYPDLAIGLSGKWSRAPEVTDQTNPFVNDRGNYLYYTAGLVLEWKLDWLPQAARTARAAAQLDEMRATERYALGGIGLEVEKCFHEAYEAERRLDAYSRATELAKRWLVKVQQGIEIGTFEDQDLVDPAKEYALKRFAQMNAVYEFNLGLAKLAQATGYTEMLELSER